MTGVWNSGDKKLFVKQKRNVPIEIGKINGLQKPVSWEAKIIIFNSKEIEKSNILIV